MHTKTFFLLIVVFAMLVACASGNPGGPGARTGQGDADTLQATLEDYLKLEPRLTDQQRAQFQEKYKGICSAYQTAGVLLQSVTDAADPASAHTAVVSYGRTMEALPRMIGDLSRLVRSFGAK